jgi:hypothetical protein
MSADVQDDERRAHRVGVQGISVASSAFLNALEYAKERKQGASIEHWKDATAPRVPIIEHADVRRMLLDMKARVEGIRALAVKLAHHQDCVRALARQGRREGAYHQGQVDLLVPLVKAYGSDQGFRVCETAIQTYGGAGYTRTTPSSSTAATRRSSASTRAPTTSRRWTSSAASSARRAARTCRRSSATSRSSSQKHARRRDARRGGEDARCGAGGARRVRDAPAHVVPDRQRRAGAAAREPLPRDDERDAVAWMLLEGAAIALDCSRGLFVRRQHALFGRREAEVGEHGARLPVSAEHVLAQTLEDRRQLRA